MLNVLFYLGLGVLIVFAFQYAIRFNRVMNFDLQTWVCVGISIAWGALALAWAYASLQEHEIQAAWVGLFLFTALSLIFVFLARRLALAGGQ
jgi:hypothetical protein